MYKIIDIKYGKATHLRYCPAALIRTTKGNVAIYGATWHNVIQGVLQYV